jgi:alkylated DNA repair dioxygenase AlkB
VEGRGLFAPDDGPSRIALPDADLVFTRRFDLGLPHEEAYDLLASSLAWRSQTIRLGGRDVMQPRLVAWHGDAGASYRYSGRRHDPLPWTPLLADLRRRVEEAAASRFNSVLANWYRDGRDSVAMHADDEPELGPEPVIASLSLGAPRTFTMKHRTRPELGTRRLELTPGSLLVMRGPTQACWLHAVPKTTRAVGGRINLTFRLVVAPGGATKTATGGAPAATTNGELRGAASGNAPGATAPLRP